eukprot:6200520-Pleurochrysis_carterae.AAC.2
MNSKVHSWLSARLMTPKSPTSARLPLRAISFATYSLRLTTYKSKKTSVSVALSLLRTISRPMFA